MTADAQQLVREDCDEALTTEVRSLLAPLRGQHILITGGTGFVGTWLTEMVARLNDAHGFRTQLTLVCRRADRFAARAPHLAARADVTVVERDVRYLVDIPPDVTYVIHAAGTPDNRQHASNPLQTLHTFIQGTDAVLDAATRLPDLRNFLHLSSGNVYGAQAWEVERAAEDYRGVLDIGSVASTYVEAKRGAETVCAAYRAQHRLVTTTVRPFAFMGPYQHLDRPWAVNNFLHDALRGGPIRILGNGATVRSYMYPSDMAVALLGLLVRGRSGAAYNLGSPEPVALYALAQRIQAQFSTLVEIRETASPRHSRARSRFVPDVGLLRRTIGVSAVVSLDAAIRRTVRWHQLSATQPVRYAVL
jgi:dTDP-glucose 4,6-dehydratase